MATAGTGTADAKRGRRMFGRRTSPAVDTASPSGLVTGGRGRRRVLDLGPVRDRLGSHWPRYAEAVYLIAEKVIRRELGPKDRHRRDGDTFVIEFDGISSVRARRAFGKIESDLSELLFGAGGALDEAPSTNRWRYRAPRPPPVARQLWQRLKSALAAPFRVFGRRTDGMSSPPAAAASDGDPPPPEGSAPTPGESVAPGAAAVPSADLAAQQTQPGPSGASSSAPFPYSYRAPRTPPPPPVLPMAVTGPAPAAAGDLPIGGMARRRQRRDEKEIRDIEDGILAATLRTAREHARNAPAVEAALRRVRFAYRPCWHIGSRSLAIFRCTPVMEHESGLLEGDAVLPNPHVPDVTMTLDHLTLANVLLDVETLLQDKRDGMVVVPLHYASFAAEWSGEPLLKMLRHMPTAGRGRIMFEIVDAFAGRTDARFRDVVHALRPYCSRLSAILPLRVLDHRFWRELGFAVVATDLTGEQSHEADLIADLDRFVLAARPLGFRTAAIGLGSRSLVLAAATMGFDIVNGVNVAHFADRDAFGQVAFDFSDLYAGQLLMGEA